ncbi:MAG: flagellar basal body P-ring protein FlgI, partial [Alphaproteobacteria bacterium]
MAPGARAASIEAQADSGRYSTSMASAASSAASRVSATINSFLGGAVAETLDSGTIRVGVPAGYPGGVVALMTEIEKLTVVPDQHARVVINEENGVIVINQDVKIAPVAIAQGSLTVRITETPQVSQPSPFSSTGTTQTVNRTDIQVSESGTGRIAMLQRG